MTTEHIRHTMNAHSSYQSAQEESAGGNLLGETFTCGHEITGDIGERLIVICELITPPVAMRVVTELLRYEAEHPGVPIHMQLFSPGGCVVSGLAIIDAMLHLESPVFTYSIGYAASMAAVILACGEKDHRYILPHSRVMIHQASGAAGGSLDNVRATLAFQSDLENDCDDLLARMTGRDIQSIREASRVDNWMRAEAARDFGLVDHILEAAAPSASL